MVLVQTFAKNGKIHAMDSSAYYTTLCGREVSGGVSRYDGHGTIRTFDWKRVDCFACRKHKAKPLKYWRGWQVR